VRSLARLVAAGAAILALAGCGAIPGTPAPIAGAPPLQVVTLQPEPLAVTVPAIDVHSTLIGLGLNPDDTAQVPPVTHPELASWYQPGVRPGADGPSVILGHVSGRPPGANRSVPGVFARLAELTPGAEILVDRTDGSTLVFETTAVETHSKLDFPTERVWGNTVGPALRLITCGGAFDPAASSYESNVVVFAHLTGIR
jgi:hypothetical protein